MCSVVLLFMVNKFKVLYQGWQGKGGMPDWVGHPPAYVPALLTIYPVVLTTLLTINHYQCVLISYFYLDIIGLSIVYIYLFTLYSKWLDLGFVI